MMRIEWWGRGSDGLGVDEGWRMCEGFGAVQARNIYIYNIYNSETPSWLRSSDEEPVRCNGMTGFRGCRGGRGAGGDIGFFSGGVLLSRCSSVLVGLAAASSPDGHRLAVLVEASSAAVDVWVGGGRHRLLPGPDRLGDLG